MGDCGVELMKYCTAGAWSSLKEVKQFLKLQGDPHTALQIYHVAGTNGKGSVCAMLSQLLWKEFGKKTGLFVSPHIIKVNERIQINGEYISDENLIRLAKKVNAKVDGTFVLSYFALLLLISIEYFLEEKVDYVVYEVGLGGTLDTTNLWSKPVATCITSISMDHTRVLGKTLSQIQWNKMGIMKEGVPCYTSVDNKLMHWGARCKKASLIVATEKVETNLLGAHQKGNAGIVYSCLLGQGYDEKKIRKGLMSITHPGRLQFVTPWLLVDGAHNSGGIKALREYILPIFDSYETVITILGSTKSGEELLLASQYFIEGDVNYYVKPSFSRTGKGSYDEVQSYACFTMKEFGSIEVLLQQIKEKYKQQNYLVLVYGSLYLASDVLQLDHNCFA